MSRGQGVVDPRAIVDPTARLDDNVTVGAWSVIGEGVHVGENSVIAPHVVIQAGSQLGKGVRIGPFCVIGNQPLAPSFLDELAPGDALTLGDAALVHAHSRVTHDVAAGVSVAGSPASPVDA